MATKRVQVSVNLIAAYKRIADYTRHAGARVCVWKILYCFNVKHRPHIDTAQDTCKRCWTPRWGEVYLQKKKKKTKGFLRFIMRTGHNEIYDGKKICIIHIMHSLYLPLRAVVFFTRFPSFEPRWKWWWWDTKKAERKSL